MSAGWVLVDDRDSTIAYSVAPGALIWHGGVAQEYDQTTTGLDAGDTLTYFFNAAMIGVFGTYGPTDASGPPIAVYQVDNAPATTVTAPITQSTLYRQGFWTSSTLPSLGGGAFHKLVVTATAPNETLWVDYLAYLPSAGNSVAPSPSSNPSSSPVSGPGTSVPTPVTGTFSPTPETGSSAPSTTLSGPSIVTASAATGTTVGTQPASAPSNSNTNIGAIVAGAVVGGFALILVVGGLFYIRRRWSRPSAGEYFMRERNNIFPEMSHTGNYSPSLTQPITSGLPRSEDTSVAREESVPERLPRPLPSTPVRSADGGVSIMGGPLDIPPEYQEHY